jgi:CxxC motif-containing protein (DUF1111 family)
MKQVPSRGSGRALASSIGLSALLLAGCGGNDTAAPSSDTAKEQAMAVTAGRYALQSVATGQCIGVNGGSNASGSALQLQACSSTTTQQFDVTLASASVYKLTVAASGLAIDVQNASASDGAPLQQWTDNGTNAQRFALGEPAAGVVTLVNVNSGKCVQAADAASLRQYGCNGAGAQQFRLVGGNTNPPDPVAVVPLFPQGTPITEPIQTVEADGTLVTYMGMRPTERHARERGEAWDAPDQGPGRYLTFPSFYFQNRTFGLVIRDEVPAGRSKITFTLRVNDGTFDGTTFSLFRNAGDPNVRDYGWALNYGFGNPKFLNADNYPLPICIAGQPDADCQFSVDTNWRTDPHSRLKVGDPVELAPAPRLKYNADGSAVIDGGGARYYSFEQLYVAGVGLRPWYGIAPNLDSAALPPETLSGGQTSLSYNYSEEPMRVFQQMANNIGIQNTKRFVEGRRLFHTSFIDGRHSEHPESNPVFSAHAGQLGPRYNQVSCIACHALNGRTAAPAAGTVFAGTVLTGTAGADSRRVPDATYGLNVLQKAAAAGAADYGVSVQAYTTTVRTLADGEKVELQKPVYAFKGPVPAQYSARQAPQVIGVGLLEALPEGTVLALADPADANGDGIRGVANLVTDPETGQTRLGRFGWKAAKASVRHQAAEALVNDMGVVSPVYPSRSCQRAAADCRSNPQGTGVNEQELQRVVQYLELLAVPAQRSLRSAFPAGVRVSPEHEVNPAQAARGAQLFAQVNCTACHVATLKTGTTHPFAELRDQTIHPYTNLLLHDMGAGLADTVAEGKAQPSMWRTAPLWGIGSLPWVQGSTQNVRYLHDGRARTLMEAIGWHGGEADNSRQRFEALSRDDRAAVLAFLNTL